ncbi:MAG: HpaII family restriction endonuclease [Ignavibacteriales bacterium]|nr:HpaII family restriction endonuclease [Ignavibacteriales bacterium]
MGKGNIGEWSELYAFLKLLGEGKLHAGDADLNKLPDVFFPIIKIIREESDARLDYVADSDVTIVNAKTGDVVARTTVQSCLENASIVLERLRQKKKEIPEVGDFLRSIQVKKLSASKGSKRDITIKVHDFHTGLKPTVGFSIKSRLGKPATLFNASKATNFVYSVSPPLSEERLAEFASLKLAQTRARLNELGASLTYETVENETFLCNLMLVDSKLPDILAHLLRDFFLTQTSRLDELVARLNDDNPCNFQEAGDRPYYAYKIKRFLFDVALGMRAAERWDGKLDATGGYIVVRKDGELLCYHLYNLNEFQSYLFNNSRLESPSTPKHEYGKVYREGDRQLIKLNLQIRFIE